METTPDDVSPEVKVVDRRASMASEEGIEHAGSAESPSDDNVADESPGFMPDPGMLLGFAAAQMPTDALVDTLLPVFEGHAWQNLGLIANPITGEAAENLPAAQVAIDMVAFLFGKAEARLAGEQRRETARRLNDLRVNYLVRSQQPGEPSQAKDSTSV